MNSDKLKTLRLSQNPLSLRTMLNMVAAGRKNLGHTPEFMRYPSGKPMSDLVSRMNDDEELRSIATAFAGTYPDIGKSEFIQVHDSLSELQKDAITKFKLPLSEIGIGLNKNGELSTELDVDIPINQLFERVEDIKEANGMNVLDAINLIKNKPKYLQPVLDFGLRKVQLKKLGKVGIEKWRSLIFPEILERILPKNSDDDDSKDFSLNKLTEEDKTLAREVFDEMIDQVNTQETSTRNSIEQGLDQPSDTEAKKEYSESLNASDPETLWDEEVSISKASDTLEPAGLLPETGIASLLDKEEQPEVTHLFTRMAIAERASRNSEIAEEKTEISPTSEDDLGPIQFVSLEETIPELASDAKVASLQNEGESQEVPPILSGLATLPNKQVL